MLKHTLALVVLVFAGGVAVAEPPPALRVVALWRQGDGTKQQIVESLTATKFVSLGGGGLGITSLAVYEEDDENRIIAVVEPVPNADTGWLAGPLE